LKDIAAAAARSGSVLLATDPDREGEAISWHITQELQVSYLVASLEQIPVCAYAHVLVEANPSRVYT
jgi:5S rRNA maturation endonuclease (ribonuclease M5)